MLMLTTFRIFVSQSILLSHVIRESFAILLTRKPTLYAGRALIFLRLVRSQDFKYSI